jgi:tRNA(Ile)-lysidine synthase
VPSAPSCPDLSHPELVDLAGRCRFPPTGAVDAAVSGGPDSLALVVLARVAGLEVTAYHVDHGLRDGSAAEAGRVGQAVSALGASFISRRIQVDAGPNTEARARASRYRALPVGVLTGHTADDQAETVLLNVLRGAALDGLAPMLGAGRVRRPLLGLRRADTHRVCTLVGLDPIRDPTNDDLRFRRNAVRHRVMPLLGEVSNRDPVPVLARQALLLADDATLLNQLAAEIDPTDAKALAAAPAPLARRAIRSWLRADSDAERHPPSQAEVERVLGVAQGATVATEVAGGRRVRRSEGRLTLDPPDGTHAEGGDQRAAGDGDQRAAGGGDQRAAGGEADGW